MASSKTHQWNISQVSKFRQCTKENKLHILKSCRNSSEQNMYKLFWNMHTREKYTCHFHQPSAHYVKVPNFHLYKPPLRNGQNPCPLFLSKRGVQWKIWLMLLVHIYDPKDHQQYTVKTSAINFLFHEPPLWQTIWNAEKRTLIKKLTDINQCSTDPANQCLTNVNQYYMS